MTFLMYLQTFFKKIRLVVNTLMAFILLPVVGLLTKAKMSI